MGGAGFGGDYEAAAETAAGEGDDNEDCDRAKSLDVGPEIGSRATAPPVVRVPVSMTVTARIVVGFAGSATLSRSWRLNLHYRRTPP